MSLLLLLAALAPAVPDELVLRHPARPGAFWDVCGRRAVAMGTEEGGIEVWVLPYQVLRDLRLAFDLGGGTAPVPGAALVQEVALRPSEVARTYAHPLFTVRETVWAPPDGPGVCLELAVDSERDFTLVLQFRPALKPMWPAGLGGQEAYFDSKERVFFLTESTRSVHGVLASPEATGASEEPAHMLSEDPARLLFRVEAKRPATFRVAIAAVRGPRAGALGAARALLDDRGRDAAARRYARLEEELLSIETPDAALDRAFAWGKVALEKCVVENPDLGRGLVAGWGLAGRTERPGFGWFFGGDAMVNSLAANALGDFALSRAALGFLARHQRADGKVMHEVSQSAGLIPWFEKFPYAYIHADTSPLYLVAAEDLARSSRDPAIAAELRASAGAAARFTLENDQDGDGVLEHAAAGLGAAETGALRGRVHQDVLLAFLSVAGFEAWTRLDPARAAAGRGARARETLEGRYWLDATGEYAYGIAADGAPLGERTAWPAAGLALVDVAPGRARRACERLASSGLMSDWGARFLSRESALYDPVSYNNGAVWPFLSGYASLACYRAGHALAGWGYLRGTAHLATLAANGCVPELLSGEFCRPLDTAVPHQLFSTAVGLLWPAVRGLLGVRVEDDRLVVAPRLPASWKGVTLRHVPFGARRLTLRCARESGRWTLRVEGERGTGPVRVRFDPLLPLGATSPGPAEATIEPPATLTVEHGPGWEVEAPVPLPAPGDRSRGPRVPVCVAEGDGLRLELEGPAGTETALRVGAPGAFRAEGARVAPDGAVVVSFPGGEGPAWRRVPVRLVRER